MITHRSRVLRQLIQNAALARRQLLKFTQYTRQLIMQSRLRRLAAAAALGVNVGQARIILFALTAMMTATIVSMVGSIGFVGLVVPHAARFVVGPLHSRLLPACAIAGAIFMVLADIASRILIPKQVLPIGVVTALVGVPFFSAILYRFQRAS